MLACDLRRRTGAAAPIAKRLRVIGSGMHSVSTTIWSITVHFGTSRPGVPIAERFAAAFNR